MLQRTGTGCQAKSHSVSVPSGMPVLHLQPQHTILQDPTHPYTKDMSMKSQKSSEDQDGLNLHQRSGEHCPRSLW